MRQQRGFTLIELMIVVVVVGILAAIAYPSYERQVRKSRRADAHTAIAAVQQAQERLRGNCPYYAQSLAGADSCGADAANTEVRASQTSPEQFYTISIQAGTASGNAYTVIATPQGAQAADTDCSPITLEISNTSPNGARTPADCW